MSYLSPAVSFPLFSLTRVTEFLVCLSDKLTAFKIARE